MAAADAASSTPIDDLEAHHLGIFSCPFGCTPLDDDKARRTPQSRCGSGSVPERADTHASRVCAKCNVRGQFVRRLTTDMEKHVSAPRLIMVELPDDPPQRLGGSYDVRAGESVSAACGHVAVHLSHLVTTLRFLFVAASPYDRRPTSGKI